MKLAWLAAIACGACGGNIRLGTELAEVDASTDSAPKTPFTAGSYAVSFLDPPQPMCSGTLAGHEADFGSITRASSNLVDGTVHLATGTDMVTLSGTPITTGFGLASVTLAPDASSTPPSLWDAFVGVAATAGPDATQVVGMSIAFDSATASSPSGIEGAIAHVYATATTDGQCSVTFGALLVSN